MSDIPELPCKQCPVACMCLIKYNSQQSFKSIYVLKENCDLLKKWYYTEDKFIERIKMFDYICKYYISMLDVERGKE